MPLNDRHNVVPPPPIFTSSISTCLVQFIMFLYLQIAAPLYLDLHVRSMVGMDDGTIVCDVETLMADVQMLKDEGKKQKKQSAKSSPTKASLCGK